MATTLGRSALLSIDLVVSQGADNVYQFRYMVGETAETATPVDMSDGWTARAQMRSSAGGAVWGTWTDELGITLDAEGYVTLHITDTETEAEAWDAYDRGYWDMELVDAAGMVFRLAEGKVKVSHDITRVD